MVSRVRLATASLLALAAPSPARSQTAAPDPWALLSVRYDTRTSHFIYAVYGYGRAFGMVGALQNPRSGYTERIGAVGRKFTIGKGPPQYVALGAAHASESWYAQIYYVPSLHRGRARVRATSELYLPLGRAGTTQFVVSPVSATMALTNSVEAGVAMEVSAAHGASASTALGPEVRLALPKAVLGADILWHLCEHDAQLRLFFLAAF